jgi:protein TonB
MMRVTHSRLMPIAIGISFFIHAIVLTLEFKFPESLHFKPLDPALEIILVNASHDKAPPNPDALAQANLSGGGNAESGRAKSPLPDLKKSVDGNALEARRRRIAELEQIQNRVIAQMESKTAQRSAQRSDKIIPQAAEASVNKSPQEEALAIARREAEISQRIEDYNKRPIKTQITPSTRAVSYAMYYTAVQKRVEQTGTLHFPQKNGKKIYGDLVVYIPIFQDGSLYMREGGPRVERSSGNAELDNAALAIVRRAAPFGQFPSELTAGAKAHVWEIVTRFSFARDDTLSTSLGKESK